MSNTITIADGITLTLSDSTMHLLFGELLVSQVINQQKEIDILANTVARLEREIAAIDDSVESLQGSVADLDSKFDDMPDLDDMAGQIDELESNANQDSIGEMESNIEALQDKAAKLDKDLNVVNLIFSNICQAIHSQVQVKV